MADKTAIEWTDATWNPIVGCSIISAGCTNCYAMQAAHDLERRFGTPKYAGLTKVVNGNPVWTGDVRLYDQALAQPLRWRRPRKIFVNSMSDLFHPRLTGEQIDRIFATMALCPQHTFQVLTKRPRLMQAYFNRPTRRELIADLAAQPTADHPRDSLGSIAAAALQWPLPNVWLGVSVENQAAADERREPMAAIAAQGWNTWVSYEPALGMVDWSGWEFIRWLVSGGESGPGARAAHPDCHRAARDWCAGAGIPFLFKQWGEWAPRSHLSPGDGFGKKTHRVDGASPNDCWGYFVGKKAAGRLLDGIQHDGYPEARP